MRARRRSRVGRNGGALNDIAVIARSAITPQKPRARKIIFCNAFNLICPVQTLLQKYFVSRLTQLTCLIFASRPERGGVGHRH
jgi:hypothetical protein